MTQIVTMHLVITFLSVIAVIWLKSYQAGTSVAIGSLLILANLLLLAWVWRRIFQKKSVALSVLIIVFKYAILGLIIYFLVRDQRLVISWFVAGLSLFLPTVLVYTITKHR